MAPGVAADQIVVGISFGNEVPAIVNESDVRWQHAADGTGVDLLVAPSVLVVAGELQTALGCQEAHLIEAIFGVPNVIPSAATLVVAIGVIRANFRSFGDVDLARRADGCRRRGRPQTVVHADVFVKIFFVSIGYQSL